MNLRLTFLAVVAFVLSGCGKKPEHSAAPALPAAAVSVLAVESKSRVATEEVVGTVRAKLRAVIAAKVSGKIDRMLVVPGQKVRQGELLATIEAREVQARLDQALAVRQQAENDLKRYATLLEQKILAQAEFDAAQSKFRVADGAVKEAETMLGYTKITAPFAGVITRKLADVGDLVGDMTAPNRPLLEIEDPTALRLEADVPEAVVGKLTLGDKLPVRISALENELTGVVSEIAPAADPGSRTFLVKLDLPETPGLRAGQFGRVAMPVGETTALRVPASAIVVRGQIEMVFVVVSAAATGASPPLYAQLRIVKTGKSFGGDVELVSGVDAGEKVVVAGATALIDGQPVEVR